MNDVGVFGHQAGVRFGKQLGNDRQAGFAPCLGQQFQPFAAQPLEFIRRGARFESAPAQESGAGLLDGVGGGEQLPLILHRARAGHDLDFFGADDLAAHRHGGSQLVGLAADQLVAFLHGHDPLHLRPGGQHFQALVGPFVPDGPDHDPFHPAHDVRPVAQFLDFPQNCRLVLLRQPGFEDNNHNFAKPHFRPFAAPGNAQLRLNFPASWPKLATR